MPNIFSCNNKAAAKEYANVEWDGLTETLKIAKEFSDWNPFLKSALGGVTAVIDLGKVCLLVLFPLEKDRLLAQRK